MWRLNRKFYTGIYTNFNPLREIANTIWKEHHSGQLLCPFFLTFLFVTLNLAQKELINLFSNSPSSNHVGNLCVCWLSSKWNAEPITLTGAFEEDTQSQGTLDFKVRKSDTTIYDKITIRHWNKAKEIVWLSKDLLCTWQWEETQMWAIRKCRAYVCICNLHFTSFRPISTEWFSPRLKTLNTAVIPDAGDLCWWSALRSHHTIYVLLRQNFLFLLQVEQMNPAS